MSRKKNTYPSEDILNSDLTLGELVYKVSIPLEPKTKKNNLQIIKTKDNKRKVIQSAAYNNYEKQALWFLRPLGIDYPVNIKCLFYRTDYHRFDLTNALEAIDDILVKKKTIADDDFKILVGHDGSRVFIDKEHPRTEVYIYKVKGGEE